MPARPNAISWKFAVSVLLPICGFLVVIAATYLKGEVSDVAELLDGHVDRAGHPVLVERVDFIRQDIKDIKLEQREIKIGVNELLRRVPATQRP